MFPKYTRRLNGNRTRVSADHENIPWGFRGNRLSPSCRG